MDDIEDRWFTELQPSQIRKGRRDALADLDDRVDALEALPPGGADELDDLSDVDTVSDPPQDLDLFAFSTAMGLWIPMALAELGLSPNSAFGATAFSNDYNDLDDTPTIENPFLSPTPYTAGLLEPDSGNLYLIDPSGSETIVILDTDFPSPGASQLKRTAKAVRIIPGETATLNGSNRVAQGGTNEVADAVFQNAAGANVEVASAGNNHQVYSIGAILRGSGHDAEADNNGLYIVTGSTTALLEITKLRDADPVNAPSEAVTFSLLVPISLETLTTIRRITASDIEVNGGTDEDEDHGGANITNFGRLIGLAEEISGHIETADDKGYRLIQSAAYPFDIDTLIIQSASGTVTAALEINGTPVTDISAVAVSSTESTGTASAANRVATGDTLALALSSNAGAVDVSFSVKITRA